MRYTELTEPPEGGFINTTNDWILIKGIEYFPTVTPAIGQEIEDGVGVVLDQNGNIVDQLAFLWTNTISTGNTSEPYLAYAYGWQKEYVLVPPSFKIQNFGHAVAFYLNFKEVCEFLGVRSAK